MKQRTIIFLLLLLPGMLFSQTLYKGEINFPDILGYKTLKCDFHLHTVFSDGEVWPSFRIDEAWREGLDAIAITDHIEYQPHKVDIPSNHNRPFEIAKGRADELGITLIKGSEITRAMPPGHLNAIFLSDASLLVQEDWRTAVEEAKKQDAFIFWNHPGWEGQQPDGIARWYEEHSFLFDNKILNGIEVANGPIYFPESHEWCYEKNLTLFGNSDNHNPVGFDYDLSHGEHRTITLVFAASSSPEDIKDALQNQRTVVYLKDKLVGKEDFLKAIFNESINFQSKKVATKGRDYALLKIVNSSDVTYNLELKESGADIQFPKRIELYGNKTILFPVRSRKDNVNISGKYTAEYEVKNLITAPEKPLAVSFEFDVNVTAKKK
ncbi:MAG: histidinol-phosphatase [Bacteroidetes bacterium]|nr:histidinol-phosphatase [Bacteroidota bacterium]